VTEPDPLLPLARPVLGAREEELVLEVLRSGYLSLGPRLERFERAFAGRVGAIHASAVSSGTAGLHLALRAVGVAPGSEVVTTPFSFVASANVALYEGATPVFADIDPLTLNLDPEAAAAAVGPRTAALLPVHVFGYPADLAALEGHGVPIVEDACEALGGCYGDSGAPVGSRGHPAVFGFYANKQIATGEGGMVVCASADQKERIDSERNQGRAPDMGWLDHDRLGFNYRLSDLHCALGIAQLERLEEMLADRARVAGLYRQHLHPLTDRGLRLPCVDGADGTAARRGWFVFVVQLPPGQDRDDTVRALAARGVPAKPYFPAIHLMSYYRERFGYRPGQFPVTEEISARSVALPFFPAMTEGQVATVVSALTAVVDREAAASRPR
jgi:perosamine synthetase